MKKLLLKLMIIVLWVSLLSFMFFDDVHSYTRIMLHELYNTKNNIDVLLIGASHVYRGINPEQMSKKIELNVFNASTSSQQLAGSYYLLNEAIKGNKIKAILLDINYGMNTTENVDENGQIRQIYLITDYMKNSKDKFDYLFRAQGFNGIVSNFFPILHSTLPNPIPLIKMRLTDAYKNYEYDYVKYPNEDYMGKGFVFGKTSIFDNASSDDIVDSIRTAQIDSNNIVPEYTWFWLKKITKLCQEHEIRLILIDVPTTDASNYLEMESYEKYITLIRAFAQDNEVEYWNFNLMGHGSMALENTDYQDAVHLNGKGAIRFTEVLGNTFLGENEKSFYESLSEKFSCKDYDKTVQFVLKK